MSVMLLPATLQSLLKSYLVSKRDLENTSLANGRLANRRLENLAYGMLGSVADAEDVVQEARLKVLQLASPPLNPQAYLSRRHQSRFGSIAA